MQQLSPDTFPTDLILDSSHQELGQIHLGQVYLDDQLQPGNTLDFDGKTYQVIERRHQYQLKANRYQLHKRILQVQLVQSTADKHLLGQQWVIGDVTCRFNARSDRLRCTVHPLGPCEGCPFYELLT